MASVAHIRYPFSGHGQILSVVRSLSTSSTNRLPKGFVASMTACVVVVFFACRKWSIGGAFQSANTFSGRFSRSHVMRASTHTIQTTHNSHTQSTAFRSMKLIVDSFSTNLNNKPILKKTHEHFEKERKKQPPDESTWNETNDRRNEREKNAQKEKKRNTETLTVESEIQQVGTFIHFINLLPLFLYFVFVVLDAGRAHPTKAENDFSTPTGTQHRKRRKKRTLKYKIQFFSRLSLNLRDDSIARARLHRMNRGRKCSTRSYLCQFIRTLMESRALLIFIFISFHRFHSHKYCNKLVVSKFICRTLKKTHRILTIQMVHANCGWRPMQ